MSDATSVASSAAPLNPNVPQAVPVADAPIAVVDERPSESYAEYRAAKLAAQAAKTPTVPAPAAQANAATAEQANTGAAEQPNDSAPAQADAESGEPEAESEPAAHEEPPIPGDRRTPTQKRIDKAVRAQRDAERREMAAREEAARLKGRLEAIEAQQAAGKAQPAATAASTAAATVVGTTAMPDDPADPKPKLDAYDSYEDGIEALAAWKARQEYRALRQRERADAERAEATRAHDTTIQQYQVKVNEFRAAHEDWDAVMAASKDVPISPDIMAPYIVSSPLGPAMTYYLAQHPDECRALAGMTGPAAYAAMGKLEAKIEAGVATPAQTQAAAPAAPPAAPVAPAPVVKPVSQAPAPITPVRAGTVAGPSLDSASYAEYRRARSAQLAATRR